MEEFTLRGGARGPRRARRPAGAARIQTFHVILASCGLEFISHHTLSHLLLHVVLAVGDQDHLITDEAVFSLAVHGREHDANTL